MKKHNRNNSNNIQKLSPEQSFEVLLNPDKVTNNNTKTPTTNIDNIKISNYFDTGGCIKDFAMVNYYNVDSKYFENKLKGSKEKKNEDKNDFEISKEKEKSREKAASADRRRSFRIVGKEDISPSAQSKTDIKTMLEQVPDNFSTKCYLLFGSEQEFAILKVEAFLIKIEMDEKVRNKRRITESFLTFSFIMIDKINKESIPGIDYYKVTIYLKDLRVLTMNIPCRKHNEFENNYKSFYAPQLTILYTRYALYHGRSLMSSTMSNNISTISFTTTKKNGWDLYNIEGEFSRQGIDIHSKTPKYRYLDNTSFSFCKTYPEKLVIPYSMSDDQMKICASYRQKGRFPALTFQYKKNKKCIWRSSQNQIGFFGQSCDKDVKLISTICETDKKLVIYDARPYGNAFVNKVGGGGFEKSSHYPKIKVDVLFCNMENIHCVRTARSNLYTNVINAKESNGTYFQNITYSKWYDYIACMLKSSIDISSSLKKDYTILIHCSDGWDRTAQLCATSQMILDSYYRTIEGFAVLIEKDWLSFGHQFGIRSGNFAKDIKVESGDQRSPIFLQWLDGIYQLMIQNFSLFEFNTNLLLFLANEIYNGKYGTFLYNNNKERKENEAKYNTVSIWTYIIENKKEFMNPCYNKEESNNRDLRVDMKKIEVWNDYFYRFDRMNDDTQGNITKRYIDIITKEREAKEKAVDELIEILRKNNLISNIKSKLSDEAFQTITPFLSENEINNSIMMGSSFVVIDNQVKQGKVLSNLKIFEKNIKKNKENKQKIKKP